MSVRGAAIMQRRSRYASPLGWGNSFGWLSPDLARHSTNWSWSSDAFPLQFNNPVGSFKTMTQILKIDQLAQHTIAENRHVGTAIQRSRSIAELQDNWDGEGSCGYTKNTIDRAAVVL